MSEDTKTGVCGWVHERMDRFYSTPWGQHLRNARKEMLLAAKAMIDHKIEWLDTLGQESEPRKIEVE
jgi:dihydropteroate synthase